MSVRDRSSVAARRTPHRSLPLAALLSLLLLLPHFQHVCLVNSPFCWVTASITTAIFYFYAAATATTLTVITVKASVYQWATITISVVSTASHYIKTNALNECDCFSLHYKQHQCYCCCQIYHHYSTVYKDLTWALALIIWPKLIWYMHSFTLLYIFPAAVSVIVQLLLLLLTIIHLLYSSEKDIKLNLYIYCKWVMNR